MVDGIPKIIAAEGEKIMNSQQNIDYTIMINGLDVGDEEKNAKALAFSYPVEPDLIVKAYEDTRNGRSAIVIPVILSAAGPYTQTLIDKGNELMAKSVTAALKTLIKFGMQVSKSGLLAVLKKLSMSVQQNTKSTRHH